MNMSVEVLAHPMTKRMLLIVFRHRRLEVMNKAFVGRELRMVELKERIRALEK